MKSVSWHCPQVFIVEIGAPLANTFFPDASSRANVGCRAEICLVEAGSGFASTQRIPIEAMSARQNPSVMRNLRFVIALYPFPPIPWDRQDNQAPANPA